MSRMPDCTQVQFLAATTHYPQPILQQAFDYLRDHEVPDPDTALATVAREASEHGMSLGSALKNFMEERENSE